MGEKERRNKSPKNEHYFATTEYFVCRNLVSRTLELLYPVPLFPVSINILISTYPPAPSPSCRVIGPSFFSVSVPSPKERKKKMFLKGKQQTIISNYRLLARSLFSPSIFSPFRPPVIRDRQHQQQTNSSNSFTI